MILSRITDIQNAEMTSVHRMNKLFDLGAKERITLTAHYDVFPFRIH